MGKWWSHEMKVIEFIPKSNENLFRNRAQGIGGKALENQWEAVKRSLWSIFRRRHSVFSLVRKVFGRPYEAKEFREQ
jgi:hypothetical protein